MAVTNFTSLLKLALPTTGDLDGTWGDTVNAAITSLLDSAVAGTTTLSVDADVTLSDTNGVANQARAAVILWTASGTVTRYITAPARSKAYIVVNSSSTQSIVIRGAGPTTGVTVRKSTRALVVWNGSDFALVASTLLGFTDLVKYNVALGNDAGNLISSGEQNTVIGDYAGPNLTTGFTNTLIGESSGLNVSTGSGNTAVGSNAMPGNGAGRGLGNVAVGRATLSANATAFNYAVALGENAAFNSTSSYAVAVGYQAMYGSSGSAPVESVAVGAFALSAITSGAYNLASGYGAIGNATTASYNVALGHVAGSGLITGSYNTYVGASAGLAETGATGNTFIGAGAGSALNGTGEYNTILGRFTGNSGSLNLGSLSNYVVLSDGSAAWKAYWDNNNNFVTKLSGTAPTLPVNGAMTFELTSDTSLKVFVRGSDGVTRSATLTLS